jgi:hypothetical protein
MATDHPDYAILGGRVAVSMLHNKTKEKFSEVRPPPAPPPSLTNSFLTSVSFSFIFD